MGRSYEPTLGARLRELRRAAELTQEQLAERAGISPRTVSDIERGLKQTPHASTLELLVRALDLTDEERDLVLGIVPKRRHVQPAAKAQPVTSHLPSELTALVGRERDEASAVHILKSAGTRLLTLTGPGGVGKTRLAIRVSRTIESNYADGARFVPLASLSRPDELDTFIAMALGIPDTGTGSSRELLRGWLQSKHTLLVLDNFEHVADLAPTVTELLEACENLTVIVTSRQPLHLRGEHLFEVPPLSSPPVEARLSAADALTFSAICLFVQRAQAVQPGFQLTDDAVDPVAAICQRLDNLPLALELAAAQIRFMRPQQILSQLEAESEALGDGPVDAPQRHRNLTDTVAWSYSLLDDDEQFVLRSLSAFIGGFNGEAVAIVVGPTCQNSEPVLRSLVDKSLLLNGQGSHGPRFGMLETIRAFSLRQARVHKEVDAFSRRHAHYFLSIATEAGAEQRRTGTAEWSDRLLEDHENLLTALRWLSDGSHLTEALSLAAGLCEYWIFWGNVRLARGWLDGLLVRAQDDESVDVPAMAWVGAARLAWLQNEYGRATELYLKGLAAHQAAGNEREVAVVLNNIGTVAHLQNDYDRADEYYEKAAAAASDAGYPYGVAMPVTNRGIISMQRGEYETAAKLLDQGIGLWREIGNSRMLAVSLGNRASLSFRQQRYDDAAAIHKEALAMKRAAGDRISVAHSAGDLGWTEIERGNSEKAQELLKEALEIFNDAGHQDGVAECFEALARIDLDAGRFDSAARFYGCAELLRENIGVSHHPADLERFEAALDRLRSSADPRDVTANWAAGRATPPQVMVESLLSAGRVTARS